MYCFLCGEKDETKLREVYYYKSQGKFDRGLYCPHLGIDDKYYLPSGTSYLCFNRKKCQKNYENSNK